ESIWGRARFLVIYLVSGVGGGVLQMLVEPRAHMAGASGCWSGLLGSFAVWVALNRSFLPSRLAASWSRSITVNVMLLVFISLMPRGSWAGHLGGGVAGAVVSVPLVWSLYGRDRLRWLGWAGTAAVPLACFLILYQALAPARAQVLALERVEALAADPELPRS